MCWLFRNDRCKIVQLSLRGHAFDGSEAKEHESPRKQKGHFRDDQVWRATVFVTGGEWAADECGARPESNHDRGIPHESIAPTTTGDSNGFRSQDHAFFSEAERSGSSASQFAEVR
jgi:hypothetical protein